MPNFAFHVFTDYSIVPLSSFEGATVGYSSVRATPDKYFKSINHTLTNSGPTAFFLSYAIKNKAYRLSKMESTLDGVLTTTNYFYDNNNGRIPKTSETVTNSNGTVTTTNYFYANNTPNAVNAINEPNLIARNMIGFPIQIKQQTGNAIKWSRVRYKLFNTTQIAPEFLEECFEATPVNWITRLQVSAYTTSGMPSAILKNNFTVPETYTWSNKLLTQKVFGNVANRILTWAIQYKSGTSLVEKMTDENGLVKKYTYDPLSRLQIVQDRMDASNANVQATTNYTYQYKDVNNLYNFIGTSTTFANATNTTPLSTKQYMDGLGRPVSTVREAYTPTALNQKNNVTYDALGRQDKRYLPFESNTAGHQTATNVFGYTTYESSPLSRPVNQYAEDGKYMQTQYGANANATDVRKFSVTTNSNGANVVSPSSSYAANSLFKTIVTNENGTTPNDGITGRTEIFKDKLGRVVLTRKYVKDASNNYQLVDTYNVYDDFNNLVMVIPPDATVANDPLSTINLSLVFEYNYDYRNRLIRKKVPNADWVNFYYDARDLLTLTQDGNMRSAASGGNANKYLGTQYNEIGQVVKTGWVSTTTPLSTALAVTIADADKLTETQYYPNKTWVIHQAAKVLKPSGAVTERDYIWSYIQRRLTTTAYNGNPGWTAKQHLLSKTYVNGTTIVGDAPITDNDIGGVNWTVSDYDGAQKPLYTINYLYSGPNTTQAQEVRQRQSFTYDNGQRLKSSNYTYGLFGAGVTDPTFKLSDVTYNFKDQAIEKNTAFVNNKYLQSTDFEYNDRGWLTAINSGFAASTLDYPLFASANTAQAANYAALTSGFLTPPVNNGESNPDLFKEILRYDNPNTALPNNGTAPTPQYNGNIAQMEWQVAGREAQAYSFKYDNLERLTEANYTDIHAANWASKGWAAQYETDNKYQEKQTYDFRGNIATLNRNGKVTEVIPSSGPVVLMGIFTAMDNLTYMYDATDKNKLIKVADATANFDKGFKSISSTVNATATHYTYDANGNLISDVNKGITAITYNHLNLPLTITFTNSASAQPRRIEFIYDATGVKLRKTVFLNNVATETRDYINGIEYKGGALDRFPHTEGAVVRQGITTTFLHEYTLKDRVFIFQRSLYNFFSSKTT